MGSSVPIELWGVFAASVVGSLHCVGMCGGLATIFTGSFVRTVLYHGGRLLGYLTLGFASGFFGEWVLFKVRNWGWVPGAVLLLAVLFMALGVLGGRKIHVRLFPKGLTQVWLNFVNHFREKKIGSFLMGLGTALLPCGWLYGFVLASVATGDQISGGLVMFSFWLGTVPALLVAPSLLIYFRKRFGSRLQLAVMSLLLVFALGNLGAHLVGHQRPGLFCPFPHGETESP